MANIGTVVAAEDGVATVERYKVSICDTCSRKNKIGVCETCSDRVEQAAERYVAYNDIGAAIGDKVEYVKNRRSGIVFALIVFIVPLVCAMIAYLISMLVTDDPASSARAAVLLLVIGMVAAGLYSYKLSQKRCEYIITAVIDEEKCKTKV